MPAGRTDLTNSMGSHLIDTMWGTKTKSSDGGNPKLPGSSVIYHNNHSHSAVAATSGSAISPLDPGSDLTSVGVTFGTLGWMAPELCDPETKHLVSFRPSYSTLVLSEAYIQPCLLSFFSRAVLIKKT